MLATVQLKTRHVELFPLQITLSGEGGVQLHIAAYQSSCLLLLLDSWPLILTRDHSKGLQ